MKLDFNDALERISDGRTVEAGEIQARALQRIVWVAEWHIPGCLSESFSIVTTKRDAISCALDMCGNVRGALSDLRKYGRTDRVSPNAYVSMAITTVYRSKLGGIL